MVPNFFSKKGLLCLVGLVCLFTDLVNKDISREPIGEYLEKSNLSVQAHCGRVDPERLSRPSEPLSIIFEKSWGMRSFGAWKIPQQSVVEMLKCLMTPIAIMMKKKLCFLP